MYLNEDELRFVKFLLLLVSTGDFLGRKLESLEWYELDETKDRINSLLQKLEGVELLDKTKAVLYR